MGHLEVLDVGGGAIERDPARFPVIGDEKRVFEAAVTILEFVVPMLFQPDLLIVDLHQENDHLLF